MQTSMVSSDLVAVYSLACDTADGVSIIGQPDAWAKPVQELLPVKPTLYILGCPCVACVHELRVNVAYMVLYTVTLCEP